MKSRFLQFLSSVAPGIFIVGYVIGTGSVTSMVVAGARFGMSLTWALLLSCVFTFVMLVAISRLTILTGNTILYNIKKRFGRFAALFIIAGLMVTVTSSIVGVMGVVVDVISTWTGQLFGVQNAAEPWMLAIVFLLLLLFLFWSGRHKLFLRFVSLMVALMGFAFILTNFLIVQDAATVLRGLVPGIPETGEPHIVIAGIVGTTMAAVVLVSRSSLIAEKKWTQADLKVESRDALVSAIVTFVVSAAIMANAAGTLFPRGIRVDNAIEMVHTLEPLAGRFAIALFVTGILAAGLSSIFPNIVLLPWLIADYSHKPRDLKKPLYRFLAVLVSLCALIIPVFGGKPVAIMIASQAFSPLMMPLLIIFLLIMLNSRKMMGEYRVGFWLNAGLVLTLAFSILMFVVALQGFVTYLIG